MVKITNGEYEKRNCIKITDGEHEKEKWQSNSQQEKMAKRHDDQKSAMIMMRNKSTIKINKGDD
jgi:hypothetical protein